LLLIFSGGDLVDLLKSQNVIADAGITDLVGYLADRFGIVGDHFLGFLDPLIPDIFRNGHTMYRLKKEIQPVIAGVRLLQDTIDCKCIRTIIFRDIGFDLPDKGQVVLVVNIGRGIGAKQAPVPVPQKIFQQGKCMVLYGQQIKVFGVADV
jgi:hypothetical protein